MNKRIIIYFRAVVFSIICLLAAGSFLAEANESTSLDQDWRFKLGDSPGAGLVDYDDRDWTNLSLPHCWGWEQAQRGEEYYRGPAWYRCELAVDSVAGKRYFLRFEAASLVADIYLNGKYLGEHRGGFGAFCFEITTNLSGSGTNLLAVRVSNAPAPDIAPQSGDFSVYGGLYRPVHLLVTGEAGFSLTDHASPGVAWMQTSVSTAQAELDVTAQISDAARKNRELVIVASVLDVNGRQVASSRQKITTAAGMTVPYTLRVTVPHPHLWNGRKDPYLYQAVMELRSGPEILDSVAEPLGLRFYRIDPERGFFLNGQPYPLHGVDKHQDRQDKGWAVSEADLAEDVGLIKEIGATVIRCAHYQHSDYFYSLCDRAGILVWAEIPQVNTINPSVEFEETSRNQLLDLIRQNVNHCSIFVWSIFNEVDPRNGDPHRELQDLRNTAHGEDPTRPVIAATCYSGFPAMNKIPDLLGWNIYPGWYNGSLADYGKILDQHRFDSRSGGICISEYGAGANIAQHEDNPRQPKPAGDWHPEEWQNLVHESAWAAMKARPFVWGTFVWNMFDFAVSTRHEGDLPGLNDKGLVTYDRKTKKDAFYFYQANWSDEPVLYLTSRRFAVRTNAVTDVKIYSNAEKVELSVNGVSQGAQVGDGSRIFVWRGEHLNPGKNFIAASAIEKGIQLNDKCVWTLLK